MDQCSTMRRYNSMIMCTKDFLALPCFHFCSCYFTIRIYFFFTFASLLPLELLFQRIFHNLPTDHRSATDFDFLFVRAQYLAISFVSDRRADPAAIRLFAHENWIWILFRHFWPCFGSSSISETSARWATFNLTLHFRFIALFFVDVQHAQRWVIPVNDPTRSALSEQLAVHATMVERETSDRTNTSGTRENTGEQKDRTACWKCETISNIC